MAVAEERRMGLEQAQELRNSNLWKWVVTEIDYRISCKMKQLMSCKESDLRIAQQEVLLLESLKRLPDDVVDREDTGSTSAE